MEVFGLPVHPLVVHAAVVFVPLTMLGALLVSFWRKGRERYGTLALILSVVTVVVVLVAKLSGDALRAGLPAVPPVVDAHETYGSALIWPSLAAVIGIGLVLVADWLTGRAPTSAEPGTVTARARAFRVVGIAVNVLAAATGLTLVILTGHSGATAVWG
ncbi:DUF2231 domain-containing protein [Propionicicella superfundia]|uniref:DUF2231 domain-containing protein n=1 Tax=Propionicicella superfundia TaxID=348582 RepID=UPI00041BA78E|nr:DUF2231 domain-containing protein [Propionicicella superfundia]